MCYSTHLVKNDIRNKHPITLSSMKICNISQTGLFLQSLALWVLEQSAIDILVSSLALSTGCRDSQFNSFPYWQAVASMFQPKIHYNQLPPRQKKKKEKVHYQECLQFFCKLNSPQNFTCLLGKLRSQYHQPRLTDTPFFACYLSIYMYS